jgi:hypothetical protein
MKVKLYFVTFKNDLELQATFDTLLNSGICDYDFEITIVNNAEQYPIEIAIHPKIAERTKFVTNGLRIERTRTGAHTPGHLARDWNFGLVDGFKSISKPDADLVVLCQNDLAFIPNGFHKIVEGHDRYNFITCGPGDTLHSYTIDAIKILGLWDERFCSRVYQEGDYFTRNVAVNSKGCSINDREHGRVYNPILDDDAILDLNVKPRNRRFDRTYLEYGEDVFKKINQDLYNAKWSRVKSGFWENRHIEKIKQLSIPTQFKQPVFYPYFELEHVNENIYQYYT